MYVNVYVSMYVNVYILLTNFEMVNGFRSKM